MSTVTQDAEKKAAETHATEPKPAKKSAEAKLDELLALPARDLEKLYVGASVPRIFDLSGDLAGRMLVSPHGGPVLSATMRSLSGWSRFPWRGKSFTPRTSTRGEGINRVFTDQNKWFRFETFIGKSRAGDFDALQLDYDFPENPFFIRAIKDEVRTLEPGLFLGQAWLVAGTPKLVLYFALATR